MVVYFSGNLSHRIKPAILIVLNCALYVVLVAVRQPLDTNPTFLIPDWAKRVCPKSNTPQRCKLSGILFVHQQHLMPQLNFFIVILLLLNLELLQDAYSSKGCV